MRYPITIRAEEATDGTALWLSISELPNPYTGEPTFTQGDDPADCVYMAADLEELWLEVYAEIGKTPPVPSYEQLGTHSGGMSVTLCMTVDGSGKQVFEEHYG